MNCSTYYTCSEVSYQHPLYRNERGDELCRVAVQAPWYKVSCCNVVTMNACGAQRWFCVFAKVNVRRDLNRCNIVRISLVSNEVKHVCVCVCVCVWSAVGNGSVPVGPVVRLVHPN